MLGGWAQDVPELDAKLLLATTARHHGWRAELLGERLSHVRDLSPDRLSVPPSPGWVSLLGAIDGFGSTLERLVAAFGVVLPHSIGAHERHLEECTPVADAPVMRALRLILADEQFDAAAADTAIGVLLVDKHAEERAAACRLRTEEMLAAAGGIAGT